MEYRWGVMSSGFWGCSLFLNMGNAEVILNVVPGQEAWKFSFASLLMLAKKTEFLLFPFPSPYIVLRQKVHSMVLLGLSLSVVSDLCTDGNPTEWPLNVTMTF